MYQGFQSAMAFAKGGCPVSRNSFLEDTRVELTKAEDDLMVEAKVSPTDIACVRPGLDATIRFGPFDYTIYGGDKRGDLR